MADEKVKVRYLGGDKPEAGSWGFEDFTIENDTAEVTPATAQRMISEQPNLWAEHKTEAARKVEDRNKKEAERVSTAVGAAGASIAVNQIPEAVTLAHKGEG